MAEARQMIERDERTEKLKGRSRLNRWLALGGMAGTLLFFPVAFLIGETRDGYSHLAHRISALSQTGAPDPLPQTVNLGFL